MNFNSLLVGVLLFSGLKFTFPQALADTAQVDLEGIPFRHCLMEAIQTPPLLHLPVVKYPTQSAFQKASTRNSVSNCDEMTPDWNRVGLGQFVNLVDDQAKIAYALLKPDKAERAQVYTQINECTKQAETLHKAALLAAQSSYNLEAPKGYELLKQLNNKKTGFRAIVIQPSPLPPGVKPHVTIAIAGTKDLKDVYSDLSFGRSQYVGDVAEVVKWAKYFLAEKDVVFTGHSLGGGLAQAMAYATQESSKQDGSKKGKDTPGKIHIVTWNAFGGKELLETTGPSKKPRNLRGKIDFNFEDFGQVVNYRLEGDVVSQLGTHLGELRTIPTTKRTLKFATQPESASTLKLHFVQTIVNATLTSRLSEAKPTVLKENLATNTLASVLNYGARTNAILHWLAESLIAGIQSEKELR